MSNKRSWKSILDKLRNGKLNHSDHFKFPKPGSNPRFTNSMANNVLWIRFKFHKFTKLNGSVFKNGGFDKDSGKPGPILYFLAPMEMQETYTHSWEDANNVAVRAFAAVTGFKKTSSDLKSLHKALNAGNEGASKKADAGILEQTAETIKSIKNLAKEGTGAFNTMVDAYKKESFYKYDAPQMYKDSPKPSYHFQFNLGDVGNPAYDTMLPVHMLKYLSSPNKPAADSTNHTDLLKYEFPYICSVDTVFGNKVVPIINMEFAAITSLQVGYNGPYREGSPMGTEITMSVSSLMPVYRSTIEGAYSDTAKNDLVTVTESPNNTAKNLFEGFGQVGDDLKQGINNFYSKVTGRNVFNDPRKP